MDHGSGDSVFGFYSIRIRGIPGLGDRLLCCNGNLQEEFKL